MKKNISYYIIGALAAIAGASSALVLPASNGVHIAAAEPAPKLQTVPKYDVALYSGHAIKGVEIPFGFSEPMVRLFFEGRQIVVPRESIEFIVQQ